MNYPRLFLAGTTLATAAALASCSILEPGETGLSPDEDIVVTSSEVPQYQPKEVSKKTIKDNYSEPVKDEGLGVQFIFQGVYADTVAGTVVTVAMKNLNDVPLPVDALKEPILEVADGAGGWTKIDPLPYDPEVNTAINAPGLDKPLGSLATTNLQYRFDTTPGSLWNARFTLGNAVWEGNLNL